MPYKTLYWKKDRRKLKTKKKKKT